MSALAFALLVLAPPAQALKAPSASDRPTVAESAFTVPPGSLQLEGGATFGRSRGGPDTLGLPELAARAGVLPRLELRASAPGYAAASGANSAGASGATDAALGAKLRAGPDEGGAWGLALTAMLSAPSGASGLSSERWDPRLSWAWTAALSGPWSAGGALGYAGPTRGGRRADLAHAAFSLSRPVQAASLLLEWAGEFPERGRPAGLLQAGATWPVAGPLQLDVRAGAGLTAASPDAFAGGGLCARW